MTEDTSGAVGIMITWTPIQLFMNFWPMHNPMCHGPWVTLTITSTLRKLQSKIHQTTLQRWRCITDETAAERMQGRMLGCQPRVHYPSAFTFFLWSSLIFPLFATPNPFRHSHLIWGRKCGFLFLRIFSFCREDHCWQSHLMQCNEANPFSLSSFLSFCDKNFCDKLCPVLDWHQFLWEPRKETEE